MRQMGVRTQGSLLFALGGAVQALSPSAAWLILGRVVAGVGCGLTSSSGTSYIAEVSPASNRGAMVGIYQCVRARCDCSCVCESTRDMGD